MCPEIDFLLVSKESTNTLPILQCSFLSLLRIAWRGLDQKYNFKNLY